PAMRASAAPQRRSRRSWTYARRFSGHWAGRRARRRRRSPRRSSGWRGCTQAWGLRSRETATSRRRSSRWPSRCFPRPCATSKSTQTRLASRCASAVTTGPSCSRCPTTASTGASERREWVCGSPPWRRCTAAGSSNLASASPAPGSFASWFRTMADETRSPERLRVLVVDDHDVVHWGFRLMLTQQSWVERCVSAHSGEEAVEMAARYRPHVALVDLFIGEESGAEVCEQIREADPSTRVLLFSGAGEISPHAARAAGASGFAYKDWPAARIAAAV